MAKVLSISEKVQLVIDCARGISYAAIADEVNSKDSERTKVSRYEVRHLYRNFLKNGTVLNREETHKSLEKVRTSTVNENSVLQQIQTDPHTSIRRIANTTNYSMGTVQKILRKNGLFPYKLQYRQALYPGDLQRRKHMCEWFINKIEENPGFHGQVLFLMRPLSILWSSTNPHWMRANKDKSGPKNF
uniref:CSON002208 protein n=1 Tax=Culicoides sonorensis TaxID=179676 RepID=A0A336LUK2_CULSO